MAMLTAHFLPVPLVAGRPDKVVSPGQTTEQPAVAHSDSVSGVGTHGPRYGRAPKAAKDGLFVSGCCTDDVPPMANDS